MKITAAGARPGDILLDAQGTAWQRGAEFYNWATFAGLYPYEGSWSDQLGPQGELDLLVRNGQRVTPGACGRRTRAS